MTEPFINDPDFTLYVGDVRDVLRELPDESVHACITSPPYWGLRDYSVDGQLGLEATPDLYVENMVAVFREVRRVLRRDGTCWLNLGDSHANKQLQGVPWKVAFALQGDGWYLRADVIWSKPNPMPESVSDRPTKAHEYLFLLTRSPRYFYDADAIREPHTTPNGMGWAKATATQDTMKTDGDFTRPRDRKGLGMLSMTCDPAGRNRRSVWEIATEPYPDAHFATFPQALVEPCVKAGTSERGCCPECGAPWEREVERERPDLSQFAHRGGVQKYDAAGRNDKDGPAGRISGQEWARLSRTTTTGWRPSCGHGLEPVPCTVLDPFMGSGTTALVARRLGRRSIGVELNQGYADLAARRLAQLSLLA